MCSVSVYQINTPSCYFYKLALWNTVRCIYIGSKYSQSKPATLTQDTRTLGNKMLQQPPPPARRCSRWLPPLYHHSSIRKRSCGGRGSCLGFWAAAGSSISVVTSWLLATAWQCSETMGSQVQGPVRALDDDDDECVLLYVSDRSA